jgi:hypothetical protein
MELRTRSAWLALFVAPAGIFQAFSRQLIQGVWWPFWIDDVLSALALGICALLVLQETTSTRARALSAAWGATLVSMWTSTFRHVNNLPGEGYTPHLTLITMLMIALLGLSVLGLALSLPTTRKPFIGTRPPKD